MKVVKKAMGWCTLQCKILLFCVKTILKVSHNFELACLKKKKERKKERETLWLFGDFCHAFHATRYVVGHEKT